MPALPVLRFPMPALPVFPSHDQWGAAKSIPVLEEDKEKYNNEEYRADFSSIKYFDERNFMDALSYIGVIPE